MDIRPPEFSVCDQDNGEKFAAYTKKLDIFFSIKKIADDKDRLNYLLYAGGDAIESLYERLKTDGDGYEAIVKRSRRILTPPPIRPSTSTRFGQSSSWSRSLSKSSSKDSETRPSSAPSHHSKRR